MTAQWQKVKEILEAALEKSPDEREKFLYNICEGDESLRREVENLLASSENVGDFMEQAAIGKVAEMFVGTQENNLQTAEFLNHYRILSNLGAGGMGEVYLAEDTKLNRFVALKLLPPSKSADEDANRRLLREARSAAALDHPHICHIHEIGETDGRSFIVMQFCEGETLAEKLEKGKLELRETLDLAIQIADALANAHSHHIIHRDIKPANIIVSQNGQAKILDFGLAKVIAERQNVESEAETAKILSSDNLIVGTAPYMSPEQIRGKPLDLRTDIFSFGVMLCEMLSGKQVFKRESQAETVAVLDYEPPIAKMLADVPVELHRIVRKSLAKDKAERYRTAKELLIDLQNIRQELNFQDKLEIAASPHKTQDENAAQILASPPTSNARFAAGEIKRNKFASLAALAVLLLILSGLGLWYFNNRLSNTSPIKSIAVLPFVNESGNQDIEYLSDGMTETLIGNLSQLPNLNVKARNSVFRYKGNETDVKTIARELNVQAILSGRVLQHGQDLSLYIELVDVGADKVIWSQTYNRQMMNLLSLQNEIARDVTRNLKTKLSGADEQRLTKNYTQNIEAYQLYLKGRYHFLKITRTETQKAVSYFEQAIQADPSYALAYAGLADAYRGLALAGELTPTEFFPKAKMAAKRAIEIDDTLAEAHSVLGFITFWYEWNWNEAENQFRRALEIDPNNADAYIYYANLHSNLGQHAEALDEAKHARELDPLNLRINALEAQFLLHAGQTDEAISRLQKIFELDQNYWLAHNFASSAYIEKGMYSQAIEEARKAINLYDSSRSISFLGFALAKSGKQSEARAELEKLLKLSKEVYVSPYNIALIYNGLGERNETLVWLRHGIEQRDPRMAFLKVEPKWNNLRDDPHFQDVLLHVGFPQ